MYNRYKDITMNRTVPVMLTTLFVCLFLLLSCSHAPDTKAGIPADGEACVQGPEASQTRENHSFSPEEAARASIMEALVSGGIDPESARSLANDPRFKPAPTFMLKNLSIAPPKASSTTPGIMAYDPAYISRGRSFIDQHREILARLEKQYGTSPEILTSVLIVESRLATYPMRYNVFSVLANMAVVRDRGTLEALAKSEPALEELLHDESLLATAISKASWASRELPHLVRLADELGMDPLEIKGSISGALGPAQFIPSTFRKYGVDGNGDGRKDPFAMEDALASMANYIQKSGWKESADERTKRGALWHYNHSEVYVNTVAKIYRELIDAGRGESLETTAR